MTSHEEFEEFAKALIDFVVNYNRSIRQRRVVPQLSPGYLNHLVPDEAPDKGEEWQEVMKDVERVIMPGVVHWNSPHFHSYFPMTSSYPSMLAELLMSALNVIGVSWYAGPVSTELEMKMLNWLAKWFDLPSVFHFSDGGHGGGVLQGTSSEAIFFTMLNAKARMLKARPGVRESNLVAYASQQSHTAGQRAALMCNVQLRLLPVNEHLAVNRETLRAAIDEDRGQGLTPFFVLATLGTTNCCSFDDVHQMAIESETEEHIWLHVDAAYAGSALVCPELRHLMRGLDKAHSISINVHKWMLAGFDCSVLWVTDAREITKHFHFNGPYLTNPSGTDYHHWHIAFSRRMRALKLYFLMRLYGKEGIQRHIRNHVRLAKVFEKLINDDPRFEIFAPVHLGLVCFRLWKKSNEENEQLLKRINDNGKIHVNSSVVSGQFFIRFVVTAIDCNDNDIQVAFDEIGKHTDVVLSGIR